MDFHLVFPLKKILDGTKKNADIIIYCDTQNTVCRKWWHSTTRAGNKIVTHKATRPPHFGILCRVRLGVITSWVGLLIYRDIWFKIIEGNNLLVFLQSYNNNSHWWNLITINLNLTYYVPLFSTINATNLCRLILLAGHLLFISR